MHSCALCPAFWGKISESRQQLSVPGSKWSPYPEYFMIYQKSLSYWQILRVIQKQAFFTGSNQVFLPDFNTLMPKLRQDHKK
jgi:hypothetical protein